MSTADEGVVSALTTDERLSNLERQVTYLTTEVRELGEELEKLRTKPKQKDDHSAKIVAFLAQFPGVKFNPTSVAENLGVNNSHTADRLRTLAAQGKITAHTGDGKNPLYSFPKA